MAAKKPTAVSAANVKATSKISTKSSAEKPAEVVSTSLRPCAHCGALIPTKKIYVVSSIQFDGIKSHTVRIFYNRDHYSGGGAVSPGRK